jgi:hypothetical protein
LALTLFFVQADWASAQGWQGQARGGTTMTQAGRGTTTQYGGATAAGARRGAAPAQRGTAVARGGAPRPARAGDLDPMLAAGAFGGLGLLAFVGGRGLRRQLT